MKLQSILYFCLLPTVALASPEEDLHAAREKLIAAIKHTLEIETQNCTRGIQSDCQDALLTSAELHILNAEIALEKLDRTVRSREIRSLIDDAASALRDVSSTLDDIQDKLDE